MAKRVNYIVTDNNVTVNFDGQTHIVDRGTALADRLIKALREQKLDEIPGLVSAAKRIESFSKGNFVVKDGQIMINGVAAPKVLGDKIVKFANEGLPYQPLVQFAANLQANPSYRAVNELFTFLEKNDHPITETGNFIAYKRVRKDFKDIHSGTFDNSPGAEPTMPRNQVNEDSAQTCSHGLHVANWTYAHTQFASSDPATDIMLEVEVNPSDVVSIPVDYNNAKMRVCKYKVLGVVDKEHSSDVSLRVVQPVSNISHEPDGTEPDVEEEEEEEDEECETCIDCGVDLIHGEMDRCDECQDDEDDRCQWCDEIGCDGECEDEDEPYPFSDEIEKK
jgi:hypothetical protein